MVHALGDDQIGDQTGQRDPAGDNASRERCEEKGGVDVALSLELGTDDQTAYPLFRYAMSSIDEVLAENATFKAKLTSKDERIAELEAQIAWFRRQVFAGGKSEKADAN
ncbi:hypothetical protein [Pelagicoccus sp. SDUM812002]|uniref:hypothetical protein n=1 Tax=Pelagicoccus sp. SDUM812002 TaxID=3041266 RepID=UPI00280E2E17|nr:hypothetical protein [Pelagicoccus sp. SDUM812002]MDQ8187794.1 hypothetical protein [Pelagicoccus sp. SDUM812002]